MIKLDLNPPRKQLRQFGWFALLGFPLIGLIATWKFGAPTWALWIGIGIGLVMGLLAALDAGPAIRPVYVGMMVLAWPIGMVVSTLLLGVVFYLLFTPVGIFFRLTGRDPMHRQIDRSARSYWRERTVPRTKASYLRLY